MWKFVLILKGFLGTNSYLAILFYPVSQVHLFIEAKTFFLVIALFLQLKYTHRVYDKPLPLQRHDNIALSFVFIYLHKNICTGSSFLMGIKGKCLNVYIQYTHNLI